MHLGVDNAVSVVFGHLCDLWRGFPTISKCSTLLDTREGNWPQVQHISPPNEEHPTNKTPPNAIHAIHESSQRWAPMLSISCTGKPATAARSPIYIRPSCHSPSLTPASLLQAPFQGPLRSVNKPKPRPSSRCSHISLVTLEACVLLLACGNGGHSMQAV